MIFLTTNHPQLIDEAAIRSGRVDFRLELGPVSYTHLRAHETVLDLVCRLLLEKTTNKLTTPLSHDTANK